MLRGLFLPEVLQYVKPNHTLTSVSRVFAHTFSFLSQSSTNSCHCTIYIDHPSSLITFTCCGFGTTAADGLVIWPETVTLNTQIISSHCGGAAHPMQGYTTTPSVWLAYLESLTGYDNTKQYKIKLHKQCTAFKQRN